jgi:hypothetical protein
MAKSIITMRRALRDKKLLGTILDGESWESWRVLLIALMGETLTDEERPVFTRLTGRKREPLARIEEFWGIVGRRGGKSRSAAVLAIFQACFVDHSKVIVVGERPIVLCLAENTKQAGVVFNYVAGIVEATPMLAELVTGKTQDTLSLSTGVDIEVRAASFRGLRGVTTVAVIADECAFWQSDDSGSANPDTAILDAVRPSLATTGGPLIVISSPYARRGAVFDTWARHYGDNGDPLILVAQGASRDFNPSLQQKVVDRAIERDPAAASAEYLGQFRSDLEAFVKIEAVEACVERGTFERAPVSGVKYFGFVDPSGGSADSMTMAIAHRHGDRAVLDAIREVKPPFSPESTVADFATLLKTYRVERVNGDRYAGEWPREVFRHHGIEYVPAAKPKSEIYGGSLPLINSGRADLLDDKRLISQLCGLERRSGRSGKDSIDHAPGAHDDRINAAAGALVGLIETSPIQAYGLFELARRELARSPKQIVVLREMTFAPGSVEYAEQQKQLAAA